MDEESERGGTCRALQTEDERRPSLREAALGEQWDCVASDTESLAQERAYQQQLQTQKGHHNHVKSTRSEKQNENEERKDSSDEDDEELQIYDSLDVAAHSHDRKWRLQMEDLETHLDERERTSPLHSDDEYSEFRYDPNWRTNLRGAGRFNQSPHASGEKFHQNPKHGECESRKPVLLKGGYRYITDTSPAPVATPHMAADQSDHSYRLHPRSDQCSSVAPPCSLNPERQLGTRDAKLSRAFSSSTKSGHESTWQHTTSERGESECDVPDENIGRNPELSDDMQAMQLRDGQACNQQKQRPLQGWKTEAQQKGTPSLTSPTVSQNKNQGQLMESVVQRNKVTLGRNTSKRGSYVKAHQQKQPILSCVKKDTTSTGGGGDRSAHELGLLQTTQQLKVTQISKGKKGQWRQHPNPSRRQQPSAPEVTAERGGSLSFPLAKADTLTEPESLSQTSSQLLPPAINLNIHLNNPTQLLPLRQQTSQDLIINLASLHGQTFQQSASRLALSPGYQPTNQEGVNVVYPHQKVEAGPSHWQRIVSLKWPFTCEGQAQTWIHELHNKHLLQNLPTMPSSTSSVGSGTFAVLPPIGEPMRGSTCEQSCGWKGNLGCPIQRSSSDGYLGRMEKQRQMRSRVANKKLKRQTLYSQVIREPNKKISRIPFSVTKDPEGKDKEVPRLKALEYAKTIARPPLPSQAKAKQKHQCEGVTERVPPVEGLDASQLATLDLLRKRHEEEKRAVALFRKTPAI